MDILSYNDVDHVIIWCDSEEESLQLLKHLEENGFRWGSGHLPTEWDALGATRISPEAYNIDVKHRRLLCCHKDTELKCLFVTLSFKDFCSFTSDVEEGAPDELIQYLKGLVAR